MSLKPVLQSCLVNGDTYRVANSAVSLGLDTISRIQFIAEVDANQEVNGILEGDIVTLTQVADGTQIFQGIVTSVTTERGTNFTRWAVDAKDRAEILSFIRFVGIFGPQTAESMIEAAFAEHGPEFMELDIQAGSPVIDEYTSTFNSLADLVNYAAKSTGWSWTCYNGVLRFFDPLSNVVAGVSRQRDFERGTLAATRTMDNVVNVARQPAFIYNRVDFSRFVGTSQSASMGRWSTSAPCTKRLGTFIRNIFPVGTRPEDWEFVGVDISSITLAQEYEGDPEFTFDGTNLVSNVNLAKVGIPRVTGIWRRPVWAEARKQDSITEYGQRDAPVLSDEGGMSLDEALRRLSDYLDARAYPPLTLTGNYLHTDIHPGEVRRFTLPDLNLDQSMLVESVARAMSQDDLAVRITCRSITSLPSGNRRAANPTPDPLPEVFRRLENLETTPLNPNMPVGAIWIDERPVSRTGEFFGSWIWQEAGFDVVEPDAEMTASWGYEGAFEYGPPEASFFADWSWGEAGFDVEFPPETDYFGDWEWKGEFTVSEIPKEEFYADWEWKGEFEIVPFPEADFFGDWEWEGAFVIVPFPKEEFYADWEWKGEFTVEGDGPGPRTAIMIDEE